MGSFDASISASIVLSIPLMVFYLWFDASANTSVILIFLGLFFLDDLMFHLTLALVLAWSSSCFSH
jgi:hypothetical protein